MNQQLHTGRPPNMPDEPPAVPLTPSEARDRAKYIRDIVKRIEGYKRTGRSPSEIEALVPEFKRDYPKLYEAILFPENFNTGFYEQSLKVMLTLLDRMAANQFSQHEASIIVGQRGYDSYVKPQIDSQPSTSSSAQ
jgi:hypothetical protein